MATGDRSDSKPSLDGSSTCTTGADSDENRVGAGEDSEAVAGPAEGSLERDHLPDTDRGDSFSLWRRGSVHVGRETGVFESPAENGYEGPYEAVPEAVFGHRAAGNHPEALVVYLEVQPGNDHPDGSKIDFGPLTGEIP